MSYTIAKNEEANVPGWVERVRESDEIVLVDTGSTDRTIEAARDLGVTVSTLETGFFRFDTAKNAAIAACSDDADYLFTTDLDERAMPGWREKLEAAVAEQGRADLFRVTIRSHHAEYLKSRIHTRHNFTWRRPIHEDLTWTGDGEMQIGSCGIVFEHLPNLGKPRFDLYVNLMRIGVHEDPEDCQLSFWLGRELVWNGMHEEGRRELTRFLGMNLAWPVEKAKACELLAAVAPDNGVRHQYLIQGIACCERRREPWHALADFYQKLGLDPQARVTASRMLAIPGPKPGDYLADPWVWEDDRMIQKFDLLREVDNA